MTLEDLMAVAKMIGLYDHGGMVTCSLNRDAWQPDGTPVIRFEEGPEDWVFNLSEEVHAYVKARGMFAEPINHYTLGFYPI